MVADRPTVSIGARPAAVHGHHTVCYAPGDRMAACGGFDDGDEGIHAIHAQVADGEGPPLMSAGRALARLGFGHQLARRAAMAARPSWSRRDDRHHQPVSTATAQSHVDARVEDECSPARRFSRGVLAAKPQPPLSPTNRIGDFYCARPWASARQAASRRVDVTQQIEMRNAGPGLRIAARPSLARCGHRQRWRARGRRLIPVGLVGGFGLYSGVGSRGTRNSPLPGVAPSARLRRTTARPPLPANWPDVQPALLRQPGALGEASPRHCLGRRP